MSKIELLHEKWDELKKQAKADCSKIDISNLEQDFNLSSMHIKWLNYQQDWIRAMIKMESAARQIKREVTEFYKYEYEGTFDSKDQFQLFVETDKRYIELHERCQVIKAIANYCENVCDRLKSKGWEIKSWIDYQKFIHGQ